jgi:vitamin B12 transporter
MGAEIQSLGERYDDASNTTRLAPYTLIHFNASRSLDRNWQMRFKVNNLTNQDYTLASGYATPGRSFFLILTWTPSH